MYVNYHGVKPVQGLFYAISCWVVLSRGLFARNNWRAEWNLGQQFAADSFIQSKRTNSTNFPANCNVSPINPSARNLSWMVIVVTNMGHGVAV